MEPPADEPLPVDVPSPVDEHRGEIDEDACYDRRGAEASDLAEVENDAAVDGVVDSAGGDTGRLTRTRRCRRKRQLHRTRRHPSSQSGAAECKTLALAAVLAVLVVAVGVLGWQAWQQHQINQARDEALHAAVLRGGAHQHRLQ